eukprot:CAMPEP_0203817364 /NCGR_PEP_ID=MMETSP0115-20131106/24819_1 /ASSEMBLY_ACC=CAM_ASM_000227 /TAXON_ID=33651 /ORGANISM="Bicosoecid sp, Strain ms1" /LENGTH=202 /DNA_ID=CAMNT_0050726293 /DNA_START=193 /DNA_END=798 /DNA_ORIENTATION=-
MEGASSSRGATRPWSNSEHRRFLEALEVHGRGSSGMEWELMADHVGPSRTAEEVREHAYKYFLKLQAESQSKDLVEGGTASLDDGTWTVEQDAAFEMALAQFDEDEEHRWDRVAELVPGKTTRDVRTRYQKLLYDVARIEAGETVVLTYKAAAVAKKRKRELKVNVHAPPGHSVLVHSKSPEDDSGRGKRSRELDDELGSHP